MDFILDCVAILGRRFTLGTVDKNVSPSYCVSTIWAAVKRFPAGGGALSFHPGTGETSNIDQGAGETSPKSRSIGAAVKRFLGSRL